MKIKWEVKPTTRREKIVGFIGWLVFIAGAIYWYVTK